MGPVTHKTDDEACQIQRRPRQDRLTPGVAVALSDRALRGRCTLTPGVMLWVVTIANHDLPAAARSEVGGPFVYPGGVFYALSRPLVARLLPSATRLANALSARECTALTREIEARAEHDPRYALKRLRILKMRSLMLVQPQPEHEAAHREDWRVYTSPSPRAS